MKRPTLFDIMSGQGRGPASSAARAVLSALEHPYRAAVALRNAMFDGQWRKAAHLPTSTVSIGNLTTGGTGKTPMVVEVVNRLRAMGAKPAVLLRGYKSVLGKSDEEMMLAESLGPDVPVVAAPDRVHAAARALDIKPDVDIFVLDDGFQHRQVHRDLDLVLIDATQPFGFEHVLPRGLLREPPAALRRAHGVIITRADHISRDRLVTLDNRIQQLTGNRPIGHAAHEWVAFYDARNEAHALDALKESEVAAVCAIGNPQPFIDTLEKHVRAIVHKEILPDHHAYGQDEIRAIMQRAVDHHAQAIVLTEKDWVKWMPWVEPDRLSIPIYHPKLRLQLLDGSENLDALLQLTLDKRTNLQFPA